jgi:2-haloacid dehalogenase
MATRPAAVAFDVIGTVFSLEPLRGRLTHVGLPGHALELWFARTLRDGFALAAAGSYRPFVDLARGALAGLLAQQDRAAGEADLESVLGGLPELPARPDAGPAMARLREGRVPVLALTNGSAKNTRALLKASGLERYVEQVVSIDDVRAWKPRPEVHRHAVAGHLVVQDRGHLEGDRPPLLGLLAGVLVAVLVFVDPSNGVLAVGCAATMIAAMEAGRRLEMIDLRGRIEALERSNRGGEGAEGN